jgi:two-component system nitrate/nitrite response regulator NarL
MKRTRVLVADPVRIFRIGVRNLLARESDLEVVEAAYFDDVKPLDHAWPDIALIDLNLPPCGSIGAVQWLKSHCEAHTIVWSFEPTRETVLGAILGGADGYLHKEISRAGLLRSLRGVAQGEAPLSRDLASLMIDALHGLEQRDRWRDRMAVLSQREKEVLEHVAFGERNRQIAQILAISEYTVKRHVQNILGKLEVGSRGAAAACYREATEASEDVVAAAM